MMLGKRETWGGDRERVGGDRTVSKGRPRLRGENKREEGGEDGEATAHQENEGKERRMRQRKRMPGEAEERGDVKKSNKERQKNTNRESARRRA